ncbi:MAG: ABC transporter permease subunit [Brevinematales bacterium]|nr:ABC transporter permease subunit [Brevinematales bacterium]
MTPSLRGRIYSVGGLLFLLTGWWLASLGIGSSLLLPSPLSVFENIVSLLLHPENYHHILHTLKRLFGGILLSSLPGILLGIVAGRKSSFFAFLQPLILFFQSVPAIVWMLLLLLWIPKETSPLFLVFLTTFPLWVLNTRQAVLSVSQEMQEMAKVFALRGLQRLLALYLPHLVLSLATSLRSTLSLSLKVVVMAEVLAFPSFGMGSKLFWAKTYVNIEELFAWAGLLFILGWVLDTLLLSFLSGLKNRFSLEDI